MGYFFPTYIIFKLKKYILFFILLESNAKFEEELTYQFKIVMRNVTNFDLSTQKSQKFAQ